MLQIFAWLVARCMWNGYRLDLFEEAVLVCGFVGNLRDHQ